MCDYISRDMAIARLTKVEVTNRLATMTDAKREIAEMPAADVVPVVHGKWIIGTGDDEFDVKCPKCGWDDIFEVAGIAAVKRISEPMHYCPNCGAKMDGGVDNAKSV
jgi:hypothetical protein|nr:MAG TPA: DNA-directed RNA polymerase [Caudoviricetes sp.]